MRTALFAALAALVISAVVVGGCGLLTLHHGDRNSSSMASSSPEDTPHSQTDIPASEIHFHYIFRPSAQHLEHTGLYAVSDLAALINEDRSIHDDYRLASEGNWPPTEGRRVFLIGKLPGLIDEPDYFEAEGGFITNNNQIEITAKYNNYRGPLKKNRRRSAYISVDLPELHAGIYQARINFQQYNYDTYPQYNYVQKRGTPTFSRADTSDFSPLTCEFEVRAAGDANPAELQTLENLRRLAKGMRRDEVHALVGHGKSINMQAIRYIYVSDDHAYEFWVHYEGDVVTEVESRRVGGGE